MKFKQALGIKLSILIVALSGFLGTSSFLFSDDTETRLIEAVNNGNVAEVKQFLKKHPKLIDTADSAGKSLLFTACNKGNVELVKLLLSKGAEPGAADGEHVPLVRACLRANLEIVKLLIDHGADINERRKRSGKTSLLGTVHNPDHAEERKKIAELLLAKSPELVKIPTVHGLYPLHWSSDSEKKSLMLYLLEKGADIDARDKNGYTVLHHLTRWWNSHLTELLVKKGANLETADYHGLTPLHTAAVVGRLDRAKIFADNGADINAEDKYGHTPYDLAIKYAHPALADYIKSKGGKAGKPVPSKEPPKSKAKIWFMEDNGWVVKTGKHVLVFDYPHWGFIPAAPALDNGHFNPAELVDEKVVVFVSNPRGLRPALKEWQKKIKHIRFVLGFSLEGAQPPGSTTLSPGTGKTIDGIDITAQKATGGGVAFLVKADGVSLFYGGYHMLTEPGKKDEFIATLNEVKKQAPALDLVFLTAALGQGPLDGIFHTAEILRPKVILPMGGVTNFRYYYREIAKKAIAKKLKTKIWCAENRGDRFYLK